MKIDWNGRSFEEKYNLIDSNTSSISNHIDAISEAKSAAVEETNSSVPDVNRLMEKQRDFE